MEPSQLYTVVDMMTNGKGRPKSLPAQTVSLSERPPIPSASGSSSPRLAVEVLVLSVLALAVIGSMLLGVSVLLVR